MNSIVNSTAQSNRPLSGRFTTPIIDPTTGLPFQNNTIPQDRYSRLARLGVQKFFPAPNVDLAGETTGRQLRFRTT
jgi:hypothetical protein